MLTKVNKILIGLLGVQVVLACLVLLRSDDAGPLNEQALLSGFDAGAVTKLQIYADGKSTPVEIVKRGNDWVMASHWDYPVDAAKVEAALSPIAKLAASEPVATSAARHKQLRVSDTDFERKLVITAGSATTTLYIGGPAGLRRNAVRIGSSEDVWGATGISASTFGAEPREWVKGAYYSQTSRDLTKLVIQKGASKIEVDRVVAADAGSGSAAPPPAEEFKVAIDGAPLTLAAGETLDNFAVTTLFSNIATIPAIPADPKRDTSQPTATITVQRAGATEVFDVIAVEDVQYWVKQRGLDRATLVDKDRLKPLVEAARANLVSKAPEPGAGSGSAAPPPGAPELPF
jgi:hypothetical protein